MKKIDIQAIALYLAGKLPPYYGSDNIYKFNKIIRKILNIDKKEILFAMKQVNNISEKYYFNILDNLYNEDKNKFFQIFQALEIPNEVLQQA